jgi:membrane protease YdiL (CAAX protease family)
MKNKNLLLFILLVILTAIGLILFSRFAQWYEQAMGSIFSYVVMIALVLFIFAPFKFIKDKKANINIINYARYMGVTILVLVKILAELIRQTILTASYIVLKLFSKKDISNKSQNFTDQQ